MPDTIKRFAVSDKVYDDTDWSRVLCFAKSEAEALAFIRKTHTIIIDWGYIDGDRTFFAVPNDEAATFSEEDRNFHTDNDSTNYRITEYDIEL